MRSTKKNIDLVLDIIIYILTTAIGLCASYMFLVFSMIGGYQSGSYQVTYIIAGLLVVAHLASFVFVWKKATQGKGRSAAVALVLPAFVVTAAGWVFVIGKHLLNIK
ncbi:MAG: hypothetical protein ABIK92_16780 [Pseudomonadota bacterium]